MIVVIGGRPGAGKSSLAEYVSKRYGLRLVSAGQMFRQIAEERGFEPRGREFLNFHKELEKDKELSSKIDKEVDRKVAEEAEKGDCVIEGWLAGFFVKKADLKVFLNVPIKTAAERIGEREGMDNSAEITVKRERSFLRRAEREYDFDPNDVSMYDFVINTSRLSQEDTHRIVDALIKVMA